MDGLIDERSTLCAASSLKLIGLYRKTQNTELLCDGRGLSCLVLIRFEPRSFPLFGLISSSTLRTDAQRLREKGLLPGAHGVESSRRLTQHIYRVITTKVKAPIQSLTPFFSLMHGSRIGSLSLSVWLNHCWDYNPSLILWSLHQPAAASQALSREPRGDDSPERLPAFHRGRRHISTAHQMFPIITGYYHIWLVPTILCVTQRFQRDFKA